MPKLTRNPLFQRFTDAMNAVADARIAAARTRGTSRGSSGGIRRSRPVRMATRGGMVDAVLGRLGRVGGLLRSLIRPGGRQLATEQQELDALQDLAGQIGEGQRVATPPPAPARPREPGEIDIPGMRRRYRSDDPILTGEMITVTSSNVHSIGYQWNVDDPTKGTLVVRFLQSRRGGSGKSPGPTYHYYNVHPLVFESFRRAASKGVFVWDNLRIRGTVSGHRYHYELGGVAGGYVPRQAKRFGPNEYFVQRRVRARSQRTGKESILQSEIEDRLVGRYDPQPNRGAQGTPNRGTPNRGRP